MIYVEQVLITHQGRLIYHKVGRSDILSHIIQTPTESNHRKDVLGTAVDMILLGVF